MAAFFVHYAIRAPSRAAARNLAAINGLTVGTTTEAELLTRSEFQTIERACLEGDCFYRMEAENTFLNRLHLASRTLIWTMVAVRDGMVIRVSVFVIKDGLHAISITQMREMPSECISSPCVRRNMTPSKTLLGISILLNNGSPIRNHLPEAVNSECLSQMHGCNTYAELMPITKDLNLDATLR